MGKSASLLKKTNLSRHVGITFILRRYDVHKAAKSQRLKIKGQGKKAQGLELRRKH